MSDRSHPYMSDYDADSESERTNLDGPTRRLALSTAKESLSKVQRSSHRSHENNAAGDPGSSTSLNSRNSPFASVTLNAAPSTQEFGQMSGNKSLKEAVNLASKTGQEDSATKSANAASYKSASSSLSRQCSYESPSRKREGATIADARLPKRPKFNEGGSKQIEESGRRKPTT
ncbi:hypothetical protein DL98DRAFT_573419 [Cadophora sp. DSE1049]|nr:hypothetical protein DL98DRAFT_573419 [Cadophora sp. DSE1049]